MRKFCKNLLTVIKIITYKAMQHLPINEKNILLESFSGISYACNPKYIYKEMIKEDLNYNYIWSLNSTEKKIPDIKKLTKRFSFQYYYYLATSKYLINNVEFAQNLPIRNEQIYLNTQHGTPLKVMGRHQPNDKPNRKSKTDRWTYLLTQNPHSSKVFRDAYMYEGEVLEIGYPRNDPLTQNNNSHDILKLKKQLGLPHDKKIVFYAPTWRKDSIKIKLDWNHLSDVLGDKYIFILRTHHLDKYEVEEHNGFIFNMSDSAFDTQELCLVSDILITDYSSIMFDYAILNRPIILFTYDYNFYNNTERGLYFDLRIDPPGKIIYKKSELAPAILTAYKTHNKISKNFKKFTSRYCYKDKGHSAQAAISKIFPQNTQDQS